MIGMVGICGEIKCGCIKEFFDRKNKHEMTTP